MDLDISADIYKRLVAHGFVSDRLIKNTGDFVNNNDKHLRISDMGFDFKNETGLDFSVDALISFAYIVYVCGVPKVDPEIIVGINFSKGLVHPVSYNNELLSHVVKAIDSDEDTHWLTTCFVELLDEVLAGDIKRCDSDAHGGGKKAFVVG